jgi:uncharacterized protein YmfQ (DUF2313 family)
MAAVARYSREDYAAQLLALLPTGRVWPKDPGSVQGQVATGLAPTFERLDQRAQQLLIEAFPGSTTELLAEWEATVGAPDPCAGEDQAVEQRRAYVVGKLVNAGGQSVAYFLGVLARLGYPDATITQYAPFRVGVDHADWPIYSEEWAHHWSINLPGVSVFYFSADVSVAGDPLTVIGEADQVICVIDGLKPAHTTVSYTFDP